MTAKVTVNVEEHARNIGGLITNLHSLELQIRCLLSLANFPEASGMPIGHKLADLAVGSEYTAGAFTNYDSLRQLIVAFNDLADRRSLKTLSMAIVELRDALAHGRCIADPGEPCFRLIKFSPVRNGRVKVAYNEVLDLDWYGRQRRMISDAYWVLEVASGQL